MILGMAILWAAWIGLDAVLNRFFTTSSDDFESRWKIWVNTFQILKDFPLFGSGLGTFPQIFPMYRSFHIRGVVTHAENDFLQLASEVGLVGVGLLFVLFLFLFYKAAAGIFKLSSRGSVKIHWHQWLDLHSGVDISQHCGKEYPSACQCFSFYIYMGTGPHHFSQGNQ